ncbi:n-terminal domain containing protein [Stylonychia lemnae]|uniref:N-terminal domain containing protein n=1 Tax=Stylonychia lemnae TaxID=5949 RepID=A0A078ASV7_STYLE|nr:n-terminal domain containing protein [Stylonychia lemnae]|eukprot:CDW85550.1 n-terminal domain containing protein [Stylonychia lemnae]
MYQRKFQLSTTKHSTQNLNFATHDDDVTLFFERRLKGSAQPARHNSHKIVRDLSQDQSINKQVLNKSSNHQEGQFQRNEGSQKRVMKLPPKIIVDQVFMEKKRFSDLSRLSNSHNQQCNISCQETQSSNPEFKIRRSRKSRIDPDRLLLNINSRIKLKVLSTGSSAKKDLEDVTFLAIMDSNSFNKKSSKGSLSSKNQLKIEDENNKKRSRSSCAQMDDNNYLPFHQIVDLNRARMIDWMIVVFRVLKKSSHKTFFLAIQLMDKYFIVKKLRGIKVSKQDLHIVGLVCIFIASKFEDVIPIYLHQILIEAAHSKFTQEQILSMELDILTTLDFKIHQDTVFEKVTETFKNLQMLIGQGHLSKSEQEHFIEYIAFLCQLITYSTNFLQYDSEQLAMAILWQTFKIQKRNRFNNYLNDLHQNQNVDNSEWKNQAQINSMFIQMKQTYMSSDEKKIRMIRFKIIDLVQNFEVQFPGLKSIHKNFPKFLNYQPNRKLQIKHKSNLD